MNQQKVWDYYQGTGLASFDGSVPRLRFLLEYAAQFAGAGRPHVLNIGTGNGWLEIMGTRRGWNVLSLDPSRVAIGGLMQRSVAGTVGVIEALPHRSASFDLVVCSEVFEHLTDEQLRVGLGEIRRVLRVGGVLLGTVPYAENLVGGRVVCPDCGALFHRWGHHQSFDRPRMEQHLRQSEFDVVSLRVRAFPYFREQSALNAAKAVAVRLVGRLGVQSAFPALIFAARRAGGRAE
jgi:SAM-dependent methyltransferase